MRKSENATTLFEARRTLSALAYSNTLSFFLPTKFLYMIDEMERWNEWYYISMVKKYLKKLVSPLKVNGKARGIPMTVKLKSGQAWMIRSWFVNRLRENKLVSTVSTKKSLHQVTVVQNDQSSTRKCPGWTLLCWIGTLVHTLLPFIKM